MKRLALIACSAAALAVGACASVQPYGPQMSRGGQGFTEQRIESDRYRVTYDSVGRAGAADDYALLRAAEVTLDNGYDWFEVTQRWVDGRPYGGGVRPSVSIGAGSSRYGGFPSSGVGVGLGLDLSGPPPTSTQLEIRLGRGQKPDRVEAYDARGVVESLRGRL